MCSPLHAIFLSTGRHLPADPAVVDDAAAPVELDPTDSGPHGPDGPDAGSHPAPGAHRELQRC